MPLPFVFASVTNIQTPQFDANYNAVSALGFVFCTMSGTNSYTLSPSVPAADITMYAAPLYLAAVVNSSNTTASTLQVSSVGSRNIYKDTGAGPEALGPGDLTQGNIALFVFDATLDSGTGGFHLVNPPFSATGFLPLTGGTLTGPLSGPSITTSNLVITAGTTQDRLISVSGTVTFTSIAAATTQDQTMTVTGAIVGDVVSLGLPSSVTLGIIFNAHVSATNTVIIRAANVTSGAITPDAVTIRVAIQGFA